MNAELTSRDKFSLTIAGLVILVPDANGVVHIIVPETQGLPMGHGEAKHMMPAHKVEILSHRNNAVAKQSLAGCMLDLTHLAADGERSLKLSSDVMNLSDIAGKQLKLAKEFVDGEERDAKVAAHIKLRGGAFNIVRTACFNARSNGKKIARAACLLEWSVTVAKPQDMLSLPVTPLRSNASTPSEIVVNQDGIFGSWLGVYNLESSDLIDGPGDLYLPPLEFGAEHVEAYWQFFQDADGEPLPCSGRLPLHFPRICPLVRVARGPRRSARKGK